jgi:nitrous oxidase accessory protein NosD
MTERKIYPYPLTIIRDRYSGMSAGGTFTAWNREVECIPDEVSGGDFESIDFWENYWSNYDNITRDFDVIGVGNTPNDAVDDLIRRLQEKDLFIG